MKRSAIIYDQPQIPFIELSVRISDGTLESSVKVPVNASPAERNAAAEKWLEIIRKTWKKMSPAAREFALAGKIKLPEPLKPLIVKAVAAN